MTTSPSLGSTTVAGSGAKRPAGPTSVRAGRRAPGPRALLGRAVPVAALAAVGLLAAATPALAGPPPANDRIENATVIPALPASITGTTIDATVGVDEPSPLVVESGDDLVGLDRSVWFRYEADFDGNVLLNACDSNFDNFVNVFSGPPAALKAVATKSNPYRACRGDRQLFTVRKGETYSVRVATERAGSTAPQGGVFRLKLAAQSAPANDAFANATPLPGAGTGAFDVPLAFSTTEFGERLSSGERGSVWFRVTPTASRPYRVTVPSNAAVETLQVFEARGRTINGLRRLDSAGNGGYDAARVAFNGIAGRTYLVRVSTGQAVPEPARLQITTDSAAGAGLLVTPERNTLAGLRARGFRASASCTSGCRVAVALSISPTEAVRYRLVTGKRRPKAPVRIGRLSGRLGAGGSTAITVPVTPRYARRLRGMPRLHVIVEARIAGARKGGAVRLVQTVR